MSYKILTTEWFGRELKQLAKKHRSIKTDLAKLGEQLLMNPRMGDQLGNDCYKIRMAITSKGKGKSSGARVITHVYVSGAIIYLLSIYDKSEQEAITEKEILARIKRIPK